MPVCSLFFWMLPASRGVFIMTPGLGVSSPLLLRPRRTRSSSAGTDVTSASVRFCKLRQGTELHLCRVQLDRRRCTTVTGNWTLVDVVAPEFR